MICYGNTRRLTHGTEPGRQQVETRAGGMRVRWPEGKAQKGAVGCLLDGQQLLRPARGAVGWGPGPPVRGSVLGLEEEKPERGRVPAAAGASGPGNDWVSGDGETRPHIS